MTKQLFKNEDVKPLWEHQLKTIKLGTKNNSMYDTSDPGTGKTRCHLEIWHKRKERGAALIIAPKTLLETAWGTDIRNYIPECSYSIAYAENREEAFKENADIYITNIDATKWLAQQPPRFFKKFNTLIIDEITYYKHRTSQRSKALNKIKKYFKYRAGLTGTPHSRTITEIWNQLNILDDGERLGKAFFKFRAAVCTPKQNGPSPQHLVWEDKPLAEQAVAGLIKDITIRHVFEDCMDIPKSTQRFIVYQPSKKLITQYNQLLKDSILELQEGNITAINAAVLHNKLLQLSSGAIYDNEGGYKILDTARYELITDLIYEREHSVVFYNWNHQKEQLAASANKKGITYAILDSTVPVEKRNAIVKQYQKGMYQTIFLHPKTGAHGLTLTRGTTTIWSSPIAAPDFLKQGNHRIYRGGQTKKTETLLIEAKDTHEQRVYTKLGERSTKVINLLSILSGE